MAYVCNNNHRELIWNSRDGVTPFIVDCATCGGAAEHGDWQNDRCLPDYVPPSGSRYFVDCSMEDAQRTAELQIERNRAVGFEPYEGLLESMTQTIYGDGHQPVMRTLEETSDLVLKSDAAALEIIDKWAQQ